MVGKTRLYQRTGSPLIQGFSRVKRRPVWPWVVGVVIVVLAVAVYFVFLR